MRTELDDKKSCYLLIITVTISEKNQIHLGQISSIGTMSKVKILFGNSSIFPRLSGCCYGYCN